MGVESFQHQPFPIPNNAKNPPSIYVTKSERSRKGRHHSDSLCKADNE